MKKALLAFVAACTVAACAGTPTRPVEQAAAAPQRPFIERSLVLAPERVGAFTLVGMGDFEGAPQAGASVRYRHDDVPEVVLDVFVYPVGRMDRGEALDYGMRTTRADIDRAAAQGAYSDVEYADEQAFDLGTVDEDGSAGPVGKDGPDLGRRQALRYVRKEGPMDSLIFMFHRGLFLHKGRLSALPKRVPQENFDRFANHAMATLVPAIEVRSTGGCTSHDIYVDPKLDGEAMQAQLLAGVERTARLQKEENCAGELDTSVPGGMRGQLLVFPPEMWRRD
ncbi:MAG: hypothetical protein ABS41_09435 [Arenimonas sp. SCN 70-307]|uniref:hypothetical protein n=1 Tax=Arenimonas sp. SCN 70-307 TaxID=1660089 RepID=UPI000869FE36|nr:hypothetical protein [Arenimonas sp. SCN 70-307]ODS62563.1 MAG: hypothetical protein ABS41_09435 [Arenimonas sp. SCN 70-307]